MGRIFTLLLVATLFTGLAGVSSASPANNGNEKKAIAALEAAASEAVSAEQWDVFSDRLVEALRSSYSGIRQTAMRYVIQYGPNVNVQDAVFDVMRVYRDGEDEALRRMAVVALLNMKSDWAMKFLERSERFEKSPCVKRTIRAVLSEYETV